MNARTGRFTAGLAAAARAVVPVILALLASALLIMLMGHDPLSFFTKVIQYGILGDNWMRSLVLMAPLLLIAVGLIVVFRGQLWNLGYGAQFLLGATVVSGLGPNIFQTVPTWLGTVVLLFGSMLIGALWTLVPAFMKAKYGTNEIITSLVMNFIGIGIVGLLIKGPLKDGEVPLPQTPVLEQANMLPYLGATTVHAGLLVALLVVIIFQYVLTQTSFGMRVDVFGASPKAAAHVGINSQAMTIWLFVVSGALIGLAGGIDMLGNESYQRANWNPHYGDAVLPFLFLARLSPLATIPFVAFYAVLATGGTLAAQQTGLNVDFLLVIIGLILIFMTLTEYFTKRRARNAGYLPEGLGRTANRLLPGHRIAGGPR